MPFNLLLAIATCDEFLQHLQVFSFWCKCGLGSLLESERALEAAECEPHQPAPGHVLHQASLQLLPSGACRRPVRLEQHLEHAIPHDGLPVSSERLGKARLAVVVERFQGSVLQQAMDGVENDEVVHLS